MSISKFIFFSAICTVLAGCAASNSSHNNQLQQLRDLSIKEVRLYSLQFTKYSHDNSPELAIEKAKEAIKNQLKDPDSAKFRNVRVSNFNDGQILCGEVNSKNSYGGYVGYRIFAAGITHGRIYDTSEKYTKLLEASTAGFVAACGR